LKNNDSATVNMIYSGSALNIFTNLPATLSAGQQFSDSSFAFTGTYQLCAIATATSKNASSQICSTQTI
jgi:hypothetical protein